MIPIRLRVVTGFVLACALATGCSDSSRPRSLDGSQQLRGQRPRALARLAPIGPVDDAEVVDVAIGLRLPHEKERDALLRDLYDPTSPRHHQFLTPEEYTEQFSPTVESYQAVLDFAAKNGLEIVTTTPNRHHVHVRASAAAIARAFHVTLERYQHPTENRTFHAPDREPSIDLDVPIQFVVGLDDFHRPRRIKNAGAENVAAPHAGGSGPSGAYTGQDFRNAYAPGVTYNGAGQTVGILEMNGYNASDISTYEQQKGFPAVPLQNVYLDGYTGGNINFESTADLELVLSMAPGVRQVTIYGINYDNTAVLDALTEMANPTKGEPRPSQISTSYFFNYEDGAVAPALKQLATQGQALFVASGDFGSYDESTGGGDFPPNDDPNVTSVGGTVLTTSSTGAWSSETTWSSSGGGYSPWGGNPEFNIPSWQAGLNFAAFGGSSTVRNMPDVAMVASDISLYFGGTWQSFAGTSAAAPLWAGLLALANQAAASNGKPPIGSPNAALYKIAPACPTCFHDITTGNNTNATNPTKYSAVAGYDLCTGLGTPNGQPLINTLVQCASTDDAFTPSASPTAISVQADHTATVLLNVAAVNPSTYSGRPIQLTITHSAGLHDGSTFNTVTLNAGSSGAYYSVVPPLASAGSTQTITISSTNGCATAPPLTIPVTVTQCVPLSNPCGGLACGSVDNGCGVQVQCGTTCCGSSDVCSAATCGQVKSDRCGGYIDCPPCPCPTGTIRCPGMSKCVKPNFCQ